MTNIENKSPEDINLNDGNPSGEGQNKQYTDLERQLYARAKKAEDKLKELEPNGKGNDDRSGLDEAWKERLELIARGYKDDAELDFIMKNGGKKALEDEFVKGAIAKKREEAEALEKVAINTSSKSTIEKTYTPEQISAMSAKELEDVLMGRKK